jgi:NAD(P)-dependent dehydrogenase (short-subunit alcohol dehydrogenase family)
VTGGASGIGAAICARLAAEGFEVEPLDVVSGFDVTRPEHWERVEPVDVACLNAGVVTGETDLALLSDEAYRRAVGVNVDGVVFGVRRLAQVMPRGGRIVATASLAGLTALPDDPIYTLTKHAVVGFVRSVAPQLAARGLSINAVCPGIADTPLLSPEAKAGFDAAGFPLLEAEEVAAAVWLALESGETGHAWAIQPGRAPVDFRFPNVPGPRGPGGESYPPPPSFA